MPIANGRSNEQVHGGNIWGVVTQEGSPSPAWWSPSLDHVLGDARLRDLKPEFEQFTVDTWRSPKRVFDTHSPGLTRLGPSQSADALPVRATSNVTFRINRARYSCRGSRRESRSVSSLMNARKRRNGRRKEARSLPTNDRSLVKVFGCRPITGGATRTEGRRPKTSKGGNRDGAGCGGAGGYGDLSAADREVARGGSDRW